MVETVKKEKIIEENNLAWLETREELFASVGLSTEEWTKICNEVANGKLKERFGLSSMELEDILKKNRTGKDLTNREKEILSFRSDIWNGMALELLAKEKKVSKNEIKEEVDKRAAEKVIKKLNISEKEFYAAFPPSNVKE